MSAALASYPSHFIWLGYEATETHACKSGNKVAVNVFLGIHTHTRTHTHTHTLHDTPWLSYTCTNASKTTINNNNNNKRKQNKKFLTLSSSFCTHCITRVNYCVLLWDYRKRQVCHCLFVCKEEDMKWNSQTFNWPAKMDPIFEVSEKRLANQREKVENEIKDR